MKVKGASISEIDPNHIRVGVDLSVTPSRTVTLESLRLTSLRLNGLPVFAEPLSQPIALVQGKEIALPPLYVTIQFRDLTTVAPLREMIEKQMVHVQGQVVAGVKMGFFEKLALHTEHPRVQLPVSQDVSVSIAASPLERQAALTVLTLLEFGMKSGVMARDRFPSLETPWVHELEIQAKTNVVEVESSFSLKHKDTGYPVSVDQLGFRLATGQVITTAEVHAPWEYDTEFLGRIKSGEAKLVKNSQEILLFSPASRSAAGIAGPYSLTHKDFTLSERGSSDKEALIIPTGPATGPAPGEKEELAKIKIRRRGVPDALSVITFPGKQSTDGFTPAPTAIAQQDAWENVAVYRLVSDPSTNKDSVEVVQFSARREGKSIHFDRSVDSSFFGSPVMVPEGVLGIVQDEETGAFLPADVSSTVTPHAASAGPVS
jgi:hypothetical protein